MLVFGIHCHQPIGNFDYVFEEAYEKAYRPFIDFFYKHEDFKLSAHFSGILFEWFLKNKKDFMEKLADMVQRNQLEIIGGGYYEPILASISKEDRILQIKKLNNFCKNTLGKSPKGIWLTERIWDTSVLQTIIELSMDYIIIDDYHIVSAGYPFEEGFYFTEDEDKKVNLVPIDKRLRYKIPFDEPKNAVDFIKSQKTSIIIDDGEKFGIWPYTYKTVYEERWLDRFYELLKQENIETKTISEALKDAHKRLVYPASVSYEEMGHWALNCEDAIAYQEAKEQCKRFETFIKGGIWKNFFTKYQESNYMHKRMLEVSKKSSKKRKSSKKDYILKAQCNDAYWHGIFGGIYFPHLRREVWNNIIKADFENSSHEIVKEDIDFDWELEVKLKDKDFIVVVSEKGIIKELSKKEVGNLNVCLSRYKEFYHFISENQEKEEGKTIHELKKDISKYKDLIAYDDKPRFFSYDSIDWNLIDVKENTITFQKENNKKIIRIEEGEFILEYNLKDELNVDINLGIHSINLDPYEIDSNHISFEAFEIDKINIDFSKNQKLKVYPIKTVSQSEKDFDVITQGICISFLAGGELSVEISC